MNERDNDPYQSVYTLGVGETDQLLALIRDRLSEHGLNVEGYAPAGWEDPRDFRSRLIRAAKQSQKDGGLCVFYVEDDGKVLTPIVVKARAGNSYI